MISNKTTYNIAITGLNNTHNPGPGVSVIRALKACTDFHLRIIGLGYDAWDPGFYDASLCDEVHLMPYPSRGVEVMKDRLLAIHADANIDVLIPTLDTEMPAFAQMAPELKKLGIQTYLPNPAQVAQRDKSRLNSFCENAGIQCPRSVLIHDEAALATLHTQLRYPLYVKGVYHDASLCHNYAEAVIAFHQRVAKWGAPVICQEAVYGEEVDVVAVGDGRGGLYGAVAMRKNVLTPDGKAWGGVTVHDPQALDITEQFMKVSRWQGPCELELLRDQNGIYHLLEINPRFPAWVYLTSQVGQNLPEMVLRLALGQQVNACHEYEVGKMFLRMAIDQVVDAERFQAIMTTGTYAPSSHNSLNMTTPPFNQPAEAAPHAASTTGFDQALPGDLS